MGDAEQVQMDTTPVFPAVPSGPLGPPRRRRLHASTEINEKKTEKKDKKDKKDKKIKEGAEVKGGGDVKEIKEKKEKKEKPIEGEGGAEAVGVEGGEEKKKGGLPTYAKALLLLSLIPIMYFIPRVLSLAGEKVQKNQHLLMYLWGVYGSILVSVFFYFKRKTITLDSFATQIMAWLIFSLGIYHLVDLPKMVDMHLRKDVLYVWCSFTMIFNLAYFFIDTTDHQEEERKERAKEEKRQKKEDERKKKKAEKRKKELEKMMDPKTRLIVNSVIYVGLVVVLGLVARAFYNYYFELQAELAAANAPPPTHNADFEDTVTEPVEGRDY